MLNSFKKLREGNLNEVDDKLLYPCLRWLSGSKRDLHHLAEVNKTFWWLPSDLAKAYIYLGLRDGSPFIKYPKAAKAKEDKAEELRKQLAQRWLNWSEQELSRNPGTLERLDFEEIVLGLGCSDAERKLLGIPIVKLSKIKKQKEKPKPKPKKTLFDF